MYNLSVYVHKIPGEQFYAPGKAYESFARTSVGIEQSTFHVHVVI